MRVLLSIKPEYADKILSGEKLYEFRKIVFKDKSVKSVVIYATMPVGKVVGEFDIDHIIQDNPKSLWELTKEFSGISKSFFDAYFSGRDKAFAIKIKNPNKYAKPLALNKLLTNGIAPQSFCYLKPR